jgi:hypothetical protein
MRDCELSAISLQRACPLIGARKGRRARGHDRGPRRDPLDADRRGGVRDRDRRERPLTGEECGMTVEGGRCYYERLTLH